VEGSETLDELLAGGEGLAGYQPRHRRPDPVRWPAARAGPPEEPLPPSSSLPRIEG